MKNVELYQLVFLCTNFLGEERERGIQCSRIIWPQSAFSLNPALTKSVSQQLNPFKFTKKENKQSWSIINPPPSKNSPLNFFEKLDYCSICFLSLLPSFSPFSILFPGRTSFLETPSSVKRFEVMTSLAHHTLCTKFHFLQFGNSIRQTLRQRKNSSSVFKGLSVLLRQQKVLKSMHSHTVF